MARPPTRYVTAGAERAPLLEHALLRGLAASNALLVLDMLAAFAIIAGAVIDKSRQRRTLE